LTVINTGSLFFAAHTASAAARTPAENTIFFIGIYFEFDCFIFSFLKLSVRSVPTVHNRPINLDNEILARLLYIRRNEKLEIAKKIGETPD
jgi:hypothetical protein